jgi:serine/threonine protein phosphatase PrpC
LLSSSGSNVVTGAVALDLRVDAAASSDCGLHRGQNEDRYALYPDLGLFVVADGMGGAAAGEVAAGLAVTHVSHLFVHDDATLPPDTDLIVEGALLRAAIRRCNAAIYHRAIAESTLQGMGTTIAALLLESGARGQVPRAVVAHVGDSRVYRLRQDRIELLTEDHSLVNDFLRKGLLRPEEAETYEHRNIITRCLGTREDVEVELNLFQVAHGDVFLLCTDGVSNLVEAAEMKELVTGEPDLQTAACKLVERANACGGHDNSTVVLVRCTFEASSRSVRGGRVAAA